MKPLSLISICLMLSPTQLFAAEGKPEAAMRLASEPIGSGALLETLAALVVILGLIVGLGWLVKRIGHLPTAGKGMVSVLGGVSLGPRERAVVLQVEDIRLLVGVAPGRIQTLYVLDGKAGDAVGSSDDNGKEFSSRLDAALKEKKE
jgi:flagellar protein FliO/FliZ